MSNFSHELYGFQGSSIQSSEFSREQKSCHVNQI